MTTNAAIWGLLLVEVLKVQAQSTETTSFTFTPDSLITSFGYVTQIRDDIDSTNGYWAIDGDSDLTPIEMALKTTMLAGTQCTVSKFQVYFDLSHSSTEGDAAIIISAGNEYISFMFDYDGGVYIAPSYTGGIAIWPPCGSTQLPQIPNNSTDTNDLFDDSTDSNSDNEWGAGWESFMNWRDRMAGGDRNNWSQFNSASRVGSHTTGFNVGFEMENTTMTIAFWTQDGTFSTQCDMNAVFSFEYGSDVHVDFSPDYHSTENWQVYGITVTTDCSALSGTPTESPTIAPSAAPSNSPINEPTQAPTRNCVDRVPQCPSTCSTDPCECDNEEIGNCDMSTCHSNGCDRCNNGSFKKYYNYPCVGCQETFGNDCMHCTDFLGCQQCSNGIRTYDPDCGLYYCNTCDN